VFFVDVEWLGVVLFGAGDGYLSTERTVPVFAVSPAEMSSYSLVPRIDVTSSK
jgi:hypothetical protein